MTAQQIARATEIVARQLVIVDALREVGSSGVVAAERTLDVFICTLRSLRDHERLLHEELELRDGPKR